MSLPAFLMPVHVSAQAPAAASAADEAADSEAGPGIAEIIVTAERRETSLQKTPLAVTVVGSEQLATAGVTEARELSRVVPSLSTSKQGAQTQFFIRGAGSNILSAFGDPAVALNIDGVYIARPYGAAAPFFDLERVEALKGPQGTLYGRNASAGAVNLITRKPEFDNNARLEAEVGNYGKLRTAGFFNLAPSDTLAVRGAFQVIKRDGYLSDGYDDEDSRAGRLHLLWEPSDATSLLLSADYAKVGGKGSAYVPWPLQDPNNPRLGPSEPPIRNRFSPNPIADFGLNGRLDVLNWGISAQLDQNITDGIALTVLASHRRSDFDTVYYPANLYGQPDNTSHQNSIEARITSTGEGPLSWLVGAYYFREKTTSRSLLIQQDRGVFVDAKTFTGPNSQIVRGSDNYFDPLTDVTWAGFGQATLSATDWLRLTVGGRYTTETKKKGGTSVLYTPALPGGFTIVPETGRLKVNKFNYKIGVEVDIAPRSMLYASLSTGFKAGGFITGAPPSAVNPTVNTYQPENVKAFTLGIKNRFFDNRLQLNLEAYRYELRDRQFTTFVFYNTGTAANATGQGIVNTERATIQGIEASIDARIFDGGNLTVGVDYLATARADKMIFRQSFLNNACPTIAPQTFDCSGKRLPFTPKLSGYVGYRHVIELANGGTITPGASVRFQSDLSTEYVPSELNTIKSYGVVDLNLGYRAPDNRWSIEAYVSNLGDKLYRRTSLGIGPGVAMTEFGPPRTYGLRASVNF